MTDSTSHILVARLAEFGINPREWHDPWCVGFHPDLIGAGEPWLLAEYYDAENWSPEEHAARVRYIMQSPELRKLPIEIDCAVHANHILAQPVVLDGWHRLHAAWALGSHTIPGEFGGRLDLLDYLTGKTKERPED